MSAHTPGPWTTGEAHGTAKNHAVCAGAYVIAKVSGNGYPVGIGWSPETEANANLIAAAPDLLAALQRSLNWLSSYPGGNASACWEQAHAAIAKATEG